MVDGLRMNLSTKGKVLSADKFGKLKTFFQMIGIIVLFIIHSQPTSNY
jgi:phosphatidylglycerophosphate synthase